VDRNLSALYGRPTGRKHDTNAAHALKLNARGYPPRYWERWNPHAGFPLLQKGAKISGLSDPRPSAPFP
jgi:hypothetical protein